MTMSVRRDRTGRWSRYFRPGRKRATINRAGREPGSSPPRRPRGEGVQADDRSLAARLADQVADQVHGLELRVHGGQAGRVAEEVERRPPLDRPLDPAAD